MISNPQGFVAAGSSRRKISGSDITNRAKAIAREVLLHIYDTVNSGSASKIHHRSELADPGQLVTKDELMTWLKSFRTIPSYDD